MSAWTDGTTIEGEVGFSNGEMAPAGTAVKVLNDKGDEIATTRVDPEGLFRFEPTESGPFQFVADLGAGHVARYDMETGTSDLIGPEAYEASSLDGRTEAVLSRMVAQAVRLEVQPLRKELALYKEKNDLQTILGAIGYILGLTGISAYIVARRKEKNRS